MILLTGGRKVVHGESNISIRTDLIAERRELLRCARLQLQRQHELVELTEGEESVAIVVKKGERALQELRDRGVDRDHAYFAETKWSGLRLVHWRTRATYLSWGVTGRQSTGQAVHLPPRATVDDAFRRKWDAALRQESRAGSSRAGSARGNFGVVRWASNELMAETLKVSFTRSCPSRLNQPSR